MNYGYVSSGVEVGKWKWKEGNEGATILNICP